MNVRNNQCEACPWKKSTRPEKDIPNGYCESLHRDLDVTISEPGTASLLRRSPMMACHDSPVGKEQPCVGWVTNQLGVGNNLGLRMLALDGRFRNLRTEGPQHARLEDTLPKRRRSRR
jgi:hypothetical protein